MKNIINFINTYKIEIIGIILILILICVFNDSKTNKMNKIHNTLITNLEKLILIFEKHQIHYWGDGGTLLGSVREGKIIKHDDDIDLGVFKEDFIKIQNDDILHQDLKKAGLHLIISKPEMNHNKIVSFREDNDYTKDKIFIDIMSYDIFNEKINFSYETHRKWWPNAYYYKNELLPFKKGKLNHLEINIPNNPIKYLERQYGDCNKDKCWKIPKEEGNHLEEINLQ